MKAEAAEYLARARATLAEAEQVATVPRVAARECYVAVFHAAQAYIFERTGRVARTHRGVSSEFARLTRDQPRLGPDLVGFLGRAYSFKQTADYSIGPLFRSITEEQAKEALEIASRFIDTVAALLREGESP